jgi:hypothetical protein
MMSRSALRVRLAVDPLERRRHEAPHHVALERPEARLRLGVGGFERRMIAGDERKFRVVWERHDLGHHNPCAVRPELFRERVAADEGDVDEDRAEAEFAGELDEGRAWFVGADHDDRLGLAAADIEERALDRDGVALVGALRDELHLALLEGPLHAGEASPAEGVVLVEDRDALDAEIFGQALDHRLGLLE